MDKDIKELNLRLDQFYKDIFREAKEREQRHDEIHQTMIRKIDDLTEQVVPVTELITNVTGFRKVTVGAIKGILLIGAGIGVIYGFIIWLRN